MHSTPHIALFMTYGGSLKIWQDAGILRREMSLYQALCARGAKISIVSYADSSDRDYFSEEFAQAGITLLTRPDCLPMRLYAKTIGWVHEEVLSGANIFKTNQVFGAAEAVRAGRFCSKPVVTRMGFHRLSYRPGEIISQKMRKSRWKERGQFSGTLGTLLLRPKVFGGTWEFSTGLSQRKSAWFQTSLMFQKFLFPSGMSRNSISF
jgi:hypothetical protein